MMRLGQKPVKQRPALRRNHGAGRRSIAHLPRTVEKGKYVQPGYILTLAIGVLHGSVLWLTVNMTKTLC
jgi:hypothetical protein